MGFCHDFMGERQDKDGKVGSKVGLEETGRKNVYNRRAMSARAW